MQKVLDHYNTREGQGDGEAVGVMGVAERSVGCALKHCQIVLAKVGFSYVIAEPTWMKFAAEIESQLLSLYDLSANPLRQDPTTRARPSKRA